MRIPRHRPARKPLLVRLRTTVQGYMLRGLLVLVPLGVTAYALILCYRLTAANLAPWVSKFQIPIPDRAVPFAVALISVVLFFAMLYLIGLATAVVLGRWVIGVGEGLLRRIPLVKTIYAASKQVMDVLQPKEDAGPVYQEAVIVDFPGPGIKTIAFVVGRTQIDGRGEYYRIFVPTTPNPTSGYLEFMPAEAVQQSDLTVEDAVKAVMSAGILVPEVIDTTVDARKAEVPSGQATVAAGHSAQVAIAKRTTLWEFTKNVFRKRILAGFFVLVPLAITAFIVQFLYDFTAGRIEPVTQSLLRPLAPYLSPQVSPVVTAVVSIFLMLTALYVTGYIATWVVGGRIIRIGEAILNRIPLIATVYGASKQIVETLLFKKDGMGFKEAVLVEFPYPGVFAVGFLVGQSRSTTGDVYHRVFVPTAPNISVGLLELFASGGVHRCELSVEDAIKAVVSCGLIAPSAMCLTMVGESLVAERADTVEIAS